MSEELLLNDRRGNLIHQNSKPFRNQKLTQNCKTKDKNKIRAKSKTKVDADVLGYDSEALADATKREKE